VAAFDHGEVADGDACGVGEGFLGHVALVAQLADCFAEGGLGWSERRIGRTVSNAWQRTLFLGLSSRFARSLSLFRLRGVTRDCARFGQRGLRAARTQPIG